MRCTLKSSALMQTSTADAFREGSDEEMGEGGKEKEEWKIWTNFMKARNEEK